MSKGKIKTKIPEKLTEITKYLKEQVGLNESFDLGVRKLVVLKKNVHLYYVNGLNDSYLIQQLIKELVNIENEEKLSIQMYDTIKNHLILQSVQPIDTLEDVATNVLSGLVVLAVEGEKEALAIDVRSYPGRTPDEPDTEKLIRGSRDGYVENIVINTAITRRRIRDKRLRFEIMQIGERSKTDVAIGYIKDVANPDLVSIIRKELEAIDIDGLIMADKAVEEYIVKQGFNPYPLVRYTERPDIAAAHLLEGHVLIFVDTSPSVIIAPTTYFHHLQHAEEYRQSPAVGTAMRWVRYIGVFISIFLLPLWLLFVENPEILPEKLDFIGPNEKTNIPVFIQIVIGEIGLMLLRMASIHTPTALATAMGLIAAVLIGQIAIDVGLFVPEVILYTAVSAIGIYATPSYELGVANTIAKLFLLAVVAIFHVPGFVIGTTVYLLLMSSIRSLNSPYLWPLIPFNPQSFLQIIIRSSAPGSKIRPAVVHARKKSRK